LSSLETISLKTSLPKDPAASVKTNVADWKTGGKIPAGAGRHPSGAGIFGATFNATRL
jgi:hypothetical protein